MSFTGRLRTTKSSDRGCETWAIKLLGVTSGPGHGRRLGVPAGSNWVCLSTYRSTHNMSNVDKGQGTVYQYTMNEGYPASTRVCNSNKNGGRVCVNRNMVRKFVLTGITMTATDGLPLSSGGRSPGLRSHWNHCDPYSRRRSIIVVAGHKSCCLCQRYPACDDFFSVPHPCCADVRRLAHCGGWTSSSWQKCRLYFHLNRCRS